MDAITTISVEETQEIARALAQDMKRMESDHARVIALEGNLGAGKTTFVQGFARALGIKEAVQSPTFVLMKMYELKQQKNLKRLIHIDCYRMESSREIEHLGLRELFNDKDAVIVIEWADRIKDVLPKHTVWISLAHGKNIHERILKVNK